MSRIDEEPTRLRRTPKEWAPSRGVAERKTAPRLRSSGGKVHKIARPRKIVNESIAIFGHRAHRDGQALAVERAGSSVPLPDLEPNLRAGALSGNPRPRIRRWARLGNNTGHPSAGPGFARGARPDWGRKAKREWLEPERAGPILLSIPAWPHWALRSHGSTRSWRN
jgi:hypothetical protein